VAFFVMWQLLANIILRNKFLIIGIITLLTVFFGYEAATGLKLDNKYGFILPKESPAKMDYVKFKEQFGEDGGALVIAIQTDSLYTEDRLLKWKQLGDSILTFDGVEGVVSEATLYSVDNNIEKQEFEVRKIFSDTRFQEKSVKQIEQEVKTIPFYNGVLYNDSTNVSLMMINVQEEFLSDQKKANVILEIEKLAQSYEDDFGKIRFAGLPHIRVVISKRIITEMYLFIGLAIFVTSLLTYLIFRSSRVVLICNIVIAVAVIWSLGSIALFGFHISVLMALIPPLMIVIGMPNCVFLMTKFHQEVKSHGNKIKALTRVIVKVGTATFITNFITALGFFTLVFTNSEKLMEFGFIAAMNILVLFVLSICILPIVSTLTQKPNKKHLRHLDRGLAVRFLNAMVYIVENHRKWVYISTAVILTLSLWGMTKVRATGNITGDLSKDHQILKDIIFIEDNFGGSIPFEVMIDYKSQSRLFKKSTLEKVEAIQQRYEEDTLFSKSISMVDFIKVINMAYYGNNPDKYEIFNNRDKLKLKTYIDNFDLTNLNSSLQMKELLDTVNTTLRIRAQIKDIGSYDLSLKAESVKKEIDSILNPNRNQIEKYYTKIVAGNHQYIDSLLETYPEVYNTLTTFVSNGNDQLQFEFDSDFDKIKDYYKKSDFNGKLRKAIDYEYLDATVTGTSVVAAEGTKYLVDSLLGGIVFAVISVALLMALLFRSWQMVFVSLVPNLIPLVITGGIMGWLGIPLKPSTLLVFNISFGITADDSIHFLAKYRQELKSKKHDLKGSIIESLREAGLGMFYTSIILFFGFSVFTFSEFGGTQALGLLVSMTLLIAISTNLILVPSVLLSFEKRLSTKTFQEPFFDVYDESDDVEWDQLEIDDKEVDHFSLDHSESEDEENDTPKKEE
jgi:predicted RND superfamily exporter protein